MGWVNSLNVELGFRNMAKIVIAFLLGKLVGMWFGVYYIASDIHDDSPHRH